jgi:hypothetical protein
MWVDRYTAAILPKCGMGESNVGKKPLETEAIGPSGQYNIADVLEGDKTHSELKSSKLCIKKRAVETQFIRYCKIGRSLLHYIRGAPNPRDLLWCQTNYLCHAIQVMPMKSFLSVVYIRQYINKDRKKAQNSMKVSKSSQSTQKHEISCNSQSNGRSRLQLSTEKKVGITC